MELIRFPKNFAKLCFRPSIDLAVLETKIEEIYEHVRQENDQALFHYTELYDGIKLSTLLVTAEELEQSSKLLPSDLKNAILRAKANIEKFHRSQLEETKKIETTPGVYCWRRSVAIGKVGLYIPGGTAPLFSSVLMLAVPAQIAGCKEIVLCTPPDKAGNVHPTILYAASICGVSKIIKVGGAQAIAALACGTESVPQVYKIFGPGNQYVAAAKRRAVKEGVAIDIEAGPTELAIIADEQARPDFVAADILSQLEHGNDSQVLCVSNSEKMLEAIALEVKKQLATLPRQEFVQSSLSNSKLVLMETIKEALSLINHYAPEHLILALRDAEHWSEQVENAGSVFIGNLTPESAGDYASGTNHTLPTAGAARYTAGVSLDSFVKKITFQELTSEGMKLLAPIVETMAEAEGLEAHKRAMAIRRKDT
jgi:histidinol dehydrogenase